MEASSLIGKTVQAIWTFEPSTVHPAWVNELTTLVAVSMAFLELSGGEFVQVSPCEVDLQGERYPSLGLILECCTSNALVATLPNHRRIEATRLIAAAKLQPMPVVQIEESDPLREGAVSQFRLLGSDSKFIMFRHIMPPMTLGIDVGV